MRIYSASIVFWGEQFVQHHPVASTSDMYSSLDAFLDFCILESNQNPLFIKSDLHIYAMEVERKEDGTLRLLQERALECKNFKSSVK